MAQPQEIKSTLPEPYGLSGFKRRDFFKYLARSTVSLAALSKATAAVYQSITSLNQKYPGDDSPDGVYWDGIRRQFMFEDGLVMMNCGTVGPMPKPVYNTLIKYFKVQCCNPYDVYNFLPGIRKDVRHKLARFINASPEEVVITHNTTEGLNFAVSGLDMKEGDIDNLVQAVRELVRHRV
ncbi:MAG: aminotransferase class V-fold PLP-dependent enzyme [Spirochaetota bacterium]